MPVRPRVLVPLLLLVLSASVVGCRSAATCPAQPLTDPGDALTALESRTWSSLKVEARVTQWADRGRIRGTVLMFFEQPSRVRFDVMTQLGPAAVLTSDGESFQLSDLRNNTFIEGPTCPDNIARLLGVAIEGEDVIRLLTGSAPLIDAESQAIECRGGSYTVVLRAADGTTQEVELAIDPNHSAEALTPPELTPVESSVTGPDGSLEWRVTWGDYESVEGVRFPTDIRMIDYRNGADTEVRIKSLDLNPSVPAAAFQQVPRPGMAVDLAQCPE